MQRDNLLERTLMLGKTEGKRRRQKQKMRWLDITTDSWIWANEWMDMNGHEFEQTPGDSEGKGSLVGYSPWGHKESDIT